MKFASRTNIAAMKYTFSATKGHYCPFNLSFFLTDGSLSVELEWNSEQKWIKSVKNLRITIPCKEAPELEDSENGSFKVDGDSGVWNVPQLGSHNTGASLSLRFDDSVSEEDILPWNVEFDVSHPFTEIKIDGCMDLDQDEDVKYFVKTEVKTENFVISN